MSDRWQQIEQLYHAALEREENQRVAFLKEACAGDDALRQEVESLLAQGDGAEGFLESPALDVAAKMLSEEPGRSLLGRRIGSYQILSLLGAGGMGEVYEARDSKLGRNVAMKVLPAVFANDPERLSRFEREARMLASLNHPNIATIHGLEQSDGVQCLVMELVPGETLAECINAGALGIEEALQIGVQIAEALESAHEKGVIHRDLKPANVKVTPEGRVKVLDFGLAKAFASESGLDLSHVPTLTAMRTQEGRILGTPAYMSPEQVRGKPVDRRTDIWAFGCVLYELLTARQAFRGDTLSDSIAGVLEREPDWQVLPPGTPEKIRELLRRCLRKDPQHRLRDIGDARIEMEEALAAPEAGELGAPAKGIGARWKGALLWGVPVLLLAAVTSVAIWNRKSSAPRTSGPVSRIAIALPPGQPLAGLEMGTSVALSPDGTHLAYAARQGRTEQLYLRPLEGLEAKPIPGTEGATSPFFSPDGKWVGFFAGGKMKKVAVSGGEALSLCDAPDPRGASWSSRGMIVFAPKRDSALQIVSDAGGTPQPLTETAKDESSHRWPEFLPGGEAVVFAASEGGANWNKAQIAVQSIRTGERRNLIRGGTQPHYSASGHLVYAQGGNLMAAPFDPRRLVVTGASIPVVEGVLQSTFSGAAQFSLSAKETLVYVPGSEHAMERRLMWVSRSGVEQPLPAPARAYRGQRLSPDGREVAVAVEGQETEVWLYDLSRETLSRLTFQRGMSYNPLWTRDGKRITFNTTSSPGGGIYWLRADGSGGLERLCECGGAPNSWSPDGKLLTFNNSTPITGNNTTWLLRMDDRKAEPFFQTSFNQGATQFSPDGGWVAYISGETGRPEVYVQPYPGPGGKWQISTEGGTEPLWNPNGKELFYRSGDKMMSAEITTHPRFSAGKPKVLFAGPYQPSQSPVRIANYDVSPDGQRFLMLKPGWQDQAVTQINVVLNWLEELKRRAP
jgi:Tol biopolymer transport system component